MHDEKLILYYYDDGLSDREKREVTAALQRDAALAERYEELRRQLERFTETSDRAAPAHAVQRWHDSVDRAARLESNKAATPGSAFSVMSFFWGAAITAALAIGIGIGVHLSADRASSPLSEAIVADGELYPETAVPAAFARGLQVYLRDSRRNLDSLPLYSAEDRAVLVRNIIDQNRLLERAAEHRNSPGLARVLRAFEPVLVRLAAEDLSPQELDALRAQLEFELNAMLTKLGGQASVEPETI